MEIGAVLVGLLIAGVVFSILGGWIAVQKGRPDSEGFILGFLFGPLGVLIEAMLPTLATPEQPTAKPDTTKTPVPNPTIPKTPPPPPLCNKCQAETLLDDLRWHMDAGQFLCPACFDKAEEARAVARAARREQIRRQFEELRTNAASSVRRTYRAIPDWAIPILAGLVLGVIAAATLVIFFVTARARS